MTYVDGYVLKIQKDKVDDYKKLAGAAGKIWMKYGALSYKECLIEDQEKYDTIRSFPDAFAAEKDELMIFAYIEYKSREHRDEVNQKVCEDPELDACMDKDNMPFDYTKMVFGGFETLVDL